MDCLAALLLGLECAACNPRQSAPAVCRPAAAPLPAAGSADAVAVVTCSHSLPLLTLLPTLLSPNQIAAPRCSGPPTPAWVRFLNLYLSLFYRFSGLLGLSATLRPLAPVLASAAAGRLACLCMTCGVTCGQAQGARGCAQRWDAGNLIHFSPHCPPSTLAVYGGSKYRPTPRA